MKRNNKNNKIQRKKFFPEKSENENVFILWEKLSHRAEWAREARWGLVVKCLKRLNNVLCLLCSRFLSFFLSCANLLIFFVFVSTLKYVFHVFPCGKILKLNLIKIVFSFFPSSMLVVCVYFLSRNKIIRAFTNIYEHWGGEKTLTPNKISKQTCTPKRAPGCWIRQNPINSHSQTGSQYILLR